MELLWQRGDFAHSAEKLVIAVRSIRGGTGAATRLGAGLQQQKPQVHLKSLLGKVKSLQKCSRRFTVKTLQTSSHCLYDGSEASEIAQDFLFFCRLAKDRRVIPANWSWSQFLNLASELLTFAFDKSCAREKYGRENIFSPMIGSGRSLRWNKSLFSLLLISFY